MHLMFPMLDLGWQTRYENLECKPRKHGHFLVCIPSYFSLSGAHLGASYLILSILIKGSFSGAFSYCFMHDYFLFWLCTALLRIDSF